MEKNLLMEKYQAQTKGLFRVLSRKFKNLAMVDTYGNAIRFSFDSKHPDSHDIKVMSRAIGEVEDMLRSLSINVNIMGRDIDKRSSHIHISYPVIDDE